MKNHKNLDIYLAFYYENIYNRPMLKIQIIYILEGMQKDFEEEAVVKMIKEYKKEDKCLQE